MAEVHARGLRFHVQRLGEGQRTVVFLHGLVMDNLSSWYFTAGTKAAKHAEVILYDLRGHGRSERPESGYSTTEMVADLAALLDALEIDPSERQVDLVGNSFGGLLAVAFALAHPERVASIVLIDAHLSAEGWGEQMAATLSLTGDARNQAIAENFKSWLGRHSERKRNRLAKTAKALVEGTSLIEDLRSSPVMEDAALAALDVPVLAIYGARSDIVDVGCALTELLPKGRLRIFDGCTHSVLWENTEGVCEAIVDWLRRA